MGQAPLRKTVEANEFILRDHSGNVRAKLSVNQTLDNPEMVLFNGQGKPSVKLLGGIGGAKNDIRGQVALFDRQGRVRGSLAAFDDGASLSLLDSRGVPGTLLEEGMVEVSHEGPATVSHDTYIMTTLKPGQATVSDDRGFQATL